MNSVKLSEKSFAELDVLRKKVESEGAITDKNSFYLFDTKTRKKLDEIAWAITYKLQEKRNTTIS